MFTKRRVISFIALFAILAGVTAYSQRPRRRSGEESLKQPFRGVVSDGKVETDLFKIESTGVSTAPVMKAANELLASLNDEQLTIW
ncbi:MAG: hypothetical protein ACI9G1_002421 [Pirellulaceae bacterium]|jgi:hypothetical protein